MNDLSGSRQFLISGSNEHVLQLANSLLELYHSLGLTEKQISALKLALDEALTNAIVHGHGGDRTKLIRVDCEWNPAEVSIIVADNGPGFNCTKVPNPTSGCNLLKECGRGLYIISAIMARMSFNDKGNEIRMTLSRQS